MSGETIIKIAEASDGHKSSLDGTEKIPAAPNNYIEVADIKNYVMTFINGLLTLKGSTDCSGNPNYPSGVVGDSYYVTVAGKIGGSSGKSVDVGDVYVCKANNAGGAEGSVGTSWFVLEHNLLGALLASNNLSDLASVITARANLGIEAAQVDVVSATTTNIGAAASMNVRITGTTTITAFDSVASGIWRSGYFSGALTLTHNGTSLILPGGANITTAAGDSFIARSLGSGNWKVLLYQKADGTAIAGGVGGSDSDAIHLSTANEISTLTEKTTLANNDLFVIEDSADSGAKKNFKAVNLPSGGGLTPTQVDGDDIATLEAWFDADQMSGSDGDLIASLTDFSSNANHATQSTTGNKPKLRLNAFNGKTAIEFDGADDSLALGTLLDFTGGHTIILVASSWSFQAYSSLFTTKQTAIYVRLNSINMWGLYRNADILCGNTPKSDEPMVFGIWCTSPTDYFIWNGTGKRYFVTAGSNLSNTVSRIGWDGSGTQVFGGLFCEARVYSSQIAEADMLASMQWLQYKWAKRLA